MWPLTFPYYMQIDKIKDRVKYIESRGKSNER